MLIIGALFLILGASVLLVSVCVSSRNLSTFGAVSTFFGALFLMIAFAVFFQHNYKSPNLDSIGSIGWSFILLIVSWPLAVVAALLALLASFNSSKQPQQDFEESE